MTKDNLQEILRLHNMWVNNEVGGKFADLCRADLCGADIDYSCWPIWCGGLHADIDDRIAIQLLYHTLSNALGSKYTSDELKAILSAPEIIDLANKFHRVEECGKIEAKR